MRISIIIPVYKVEKYLSDCLDSIISQSFEDWEAILVDDGSPDLSGVICDEYARKDNRFHVIHKRNGGVSSARNVGIANAKGEWVTFVDSDDILSFTFLQELYSPIANGESVDFVHGGCSDWTEEGLTINQFYEYRIDTNMPFLFSCMRGLPFSKLFRLEILNDVSAGNMLRFDEKMVIAEDLAFTFDYILRIEKYALVPTVGYYYRRDNYESATKIRREISYEQELHSSVHLYESMMKCFQSFKMDMYKNSPRYSECGSHFLETAFALYRGSCQKEIRISHLKNDFRNEYLEAIKYAKTLHLKRLLAFFLIRKNYRIYDFVCSLIFKAL
ncbi:MAG: glycosyltransferase family 2 protein [Paludibacteraceae bacterium]|nr:glycosyltransferase family 2 protein [Paludibacteraceae bacterium]